MLWAGQSQVSPVFQRSTPGLSGSAVNFLYVVITYGEELAVPVAPVARELLPRIKLHDFFAGVK